MALALLLALVAAPVSANPGQDRLELLGSTRDYLVVLRIGPAADEAVAASAGVVLCGVPAGGTGSEAFARGVHHVEVHVLDRMSWRVVDTAAIGIAAENAITGLRQPIPPTKMMDPGLGPADLHYGGNVYMPDGRYRIDVEAVGQPVSFDFVVSGDEPQSVPSPWTVLVGRGFSTASYVLFGAAGLVAALLIATGRWAPPSARATRGLFVALIGYQSVHEIEHVVQVVQAKLLGVPNAAGIVGSFFNLEPVHLAYNSWFLSLALAVTAGYVVWHRKELAPPPILSGLMIAATALQVYHVFEHLAKTGQFLGSGLNGVPGVLGQYADPIWLHFWLNTAAYVPFVIAFIAAGTCGATARELRRWLGPGRRRPALS